MITAAVAAAFLYGFLCHRNHVFPYRQITALTRSIYGVLPQPGEPLGQYHSARIGDDQSLYRGTETSRVLTLPYLQAYEGVRGSGVTVRKDDKVSPGYNLYVSGHAPTAVLIDMEGHFIHEWGSTFEKIFPGVTPAPEARGNERFWRFARLLPGGDLLAIFDGLGIVRLDRDSHVVWATAGGYHHDLDIAPDGSLVVLARKKRMIPRINSAVPVFEDFVVSLDSTGRVTQEISLLDCFENSQYASLLSTVDRWGDLFHTNSVRRLDGRFEPKGPPFRNGNLLISVPRLNTVAVVDPEAKRVVWAITGMFRSQHHATPLPNGNILLFDNWGRHGTSRVLELEPLSQQIVWEYPRKGGELFSLCCGGAQRLPNGNTLVVESTHGRALEVTPNQDVVWEFVNPARAGEGGRLVATLFHMRRLDPTFDVSWARRPVEARGSGS
jgi:hypothetical protein